MNNFYPNLNVSLWRGLAEAASLAFANKSTFDRRNFENRGKQTLEEIFDYFYQTSRFSDPELAAQDPLKVSLNVREELKFCVYSEPDENDENHLVIQMSTGVLYALNDLAIRAVSAEDFLNESVDNDDTILKWRGCRTIEPEPIARPKRRYYDYSATPNPNEMDIFNNGGYIGTYYKKIPFDENRNHLARILVDIALTFLFLHEESHYREGHFAYDKELLERGIDIDPQINRLLELQADKHASEGVFQIFYLPEYTKNFPEDWVAGKGGMFRIILTGIGLAIALLLRIDKINGQHHLYPSPLTRLGMAAQVGRKVVAEIIDPQYRYYFNEETSGVKSSIEFGVASFSWFHASIFDLFCLLELLDSESKDEGYTIPPALKKAMSVKIIAYQLFLKGRGEENIAVRNIVIPESQPQNECHDDYLLALEDAKHCWAELTELTRLHNSKIYKLLEKYRVKTIGSTPFKNTYRLRSSSTE